MKSSNLTKKHIAILREYGINAAAMKDAYVFTYSKGENIYMQDYSISHMFIFLQGRAKVFYTTSNGKNLLIAFYTQRGIIGDAELTGDMQQATSSVQAITQVECIGIPMAKYRKLLKNNVVFMQAACLALANKLKNSTINSTNNILNDLDVRLCNYINMTSDDEKFNEKLTEVSEMLGTSYRHLHRTLSNLCDRGILQKQSKGYTIADRKSMMELIDNT